MTRGFDEIIKRVIQFRDERDWRQFHDPKNLAEAISVESGELLEKFLWIGSTESKQISDTKLRDVEEELADIAIFMFYLCDALNIDLLESVERKIRMNEKKYPIAKARGTSKKYTEL